jgi:hypothetical protein
MPEASKVTLNASLTDELGAALAQRPDLRLVDLAEGSPRVRPRTG